MYNSSIIHEFVVQSTLFTILEAIVKFVLNLAKYNDCFIKLSDKCNDKSYKFKMHNVTVSDNVCKIQQEPYP